jgi:HD-like signal output (HDOD) protein
MALAAIDDTGITSVDLTGEPGPEAFERFYRQVTDRDELPTIPEVARRLMLAVNRESTSARELVSLLGRDQSLAAKLLRLANSAFFALRRPVTDLSQAVTLLGFGSVRDLVMTLSLWGSLGDSDPTTRKRRKILWVHCASVGATAKILAKRIGRIDTGEALSAGLLHDVGKLLLALRLGATYWDMLDQAEDAEASPTAVEKEAFGIDHGLIGQYMLQLWGLPDPLCIAVGQHHEALVLDGPIGIPQVVNAANRLVHLMGPEHVEEAVTLFTALAPQRLTAEMWPEIREEVEAEHRQIAGFFDG